MEFKQLQASEARVRLWLILTFALPTLTTLVLYWRLYFKNITLSLLVFIFPLLIYIYLKKHRVLIKNDSITIYGFLKRKVIIISDYYSFDMTSAFGITYFHLYKKGANKRSEVVSITGDKHWAMEYFNSKLKTRDEIYAEYENEELRTINSNIDKEQTDENLEEARRITKRIFIIVYIFSSYSLALSYFSFAKPVTIIRDALILAPIVLIPILWKYKGLIKFIAPEKSKFANAFLIIILPGLALSHSALFDWHILSYKDALIPSIVINAFVGILIIIPIMKTIKGNVPAYLLYILLFAMYGFGASVYINCKYDDKPPMIFNASVVDRGFEPRYIRRISISPRSYIIIDSSIDKRIKKKIKVSRTQYKKLQKHDTIEICVKEGKLGIPWFYIARNGLKLE